LAPQQIRRPGQSKIGNFLQRVGRFSDAVEAPELRAAAYSTGFINFFFRGKLVVEAPLDGLFGAIDHSIAHTLDADGYPRCRSTVVVGPDTWCTPGRIYGFTKLRLKVRNDTATIIQGGGGAVVAQALVATVANSTTGTNEASRYRPLSPQPLPSPRFDQRADDECQWRGRFGACQLFVSHPVPGNFGLESQSRQRR